MARTESGQHKHVQAVNKGYLLPEITIEPRLKKSETPENSKTFGLAPPAKPREEDEYDSDYSEVSYTTGDGMVNSQSIAVHENIAYDLDEADIATMNAFLQCESKDLGSHIRKGDGPQRKKKQPPTGNKPTTVATPLWEEESKNYDYPLHPPSGGSMAPDSVYDVARSELLPDYDVPNTPHSQLTTEQTNEREVLYQNQPQAVYQNQTLSRERHVEERMYYNEQENPDEAVYYNQIN